MDNSKDQLLDRIYEILVAAPEGLKEYTLLTNLRKMALPLFSTGNLSDSLDLFRQHFMLFHLLYSLNERLHNEQKGTIDIHCLKIVLRPWQPRESNLPTSADTMRAYYLDIRHMDEMKKIDVDAMINRFWQEYVSYQCKPKNLEVLDLPASASSREIKQRYRKLALTHHPDHGGCPDQFQRISQAARDLLGRS